MNAPLKLAIGLGTLGATGGGVYLLHQQLSTDNAPKKSEQEDHADLLANKSIQKALTDKGHTLLSYDTNKDESAIWNPIVKAYSKSKTKFKGVDITIAEDTSAEPTKENINALKNACKEFVTTSKDDEANLKIVEQFCVTPITIKELIKKHRTILNSETTTAVDVATDKLWDDKVATFFADGAKNKITDATLKQKHPSNPKENRDQIKADCKKIETKNTYDSTFHDSYSQFEEWCTNPK